MSAGLPRPAVLDELHSLRCQFHSLQTTLEQWRIDLDRIRLEAERSEQLIEQLLQHYSPAASSMEASDAGTPEVDALRLALQEAWRENSLLFQQLHGLEERLYQQEQQQSAASERVATDDAAPMSQHVPGPEESRSEEEKQESEPGAPHVQAQVGDASSPLSRRRSAWRRLLSRTSSSRGVPVLNRRTARRLRSAWRRLLPPV